MQKPQYLNVDLELASRRSVDPLVEAWERLRPPRLRALWNQAHRRAFDVGVEMGGGRFTC